MSHDFISQIIDNKASEKMRSQLADEDCAKHIKKVTCISDSEESKYDPNCSTDEVKEEQLQALIGIAKELPPFHQKVFCHLNQIQIQDRIFSAAYAGTIKNENFETIGSMMGLRSLTLTATPIDTAFDSWKEQLSFGRSTPKDPTLKISKEGPFAKEQSGKTKYPFYTYFVHELNHVIDATNFANDFTPKCENIPGKENWLRCTYRQNSFHSQFWGLSEDVYLGENEDQNTVSIPWGNKYPTLQGLCFYSCKKYLSPELIPQVYKELNESSFLTSYSTQSDLEDFAEAATVWAMYKSNIPFLVEVKDGSGKVLFNSVEHSKTSGAQWKLQWIDAFFARKDLKYHPLITP